jgi:putative PIN family toxin of toxin-antitoxin system
VKIVLDTNVLVSAFATRGLCADLFRDVVAHHSLAVSDYILEELHAKLVGKLRVPTSAAENIRVLLSPYRIEQGVLPKLSIEIRDPDDVPIVAFAVAIGADLLITGDRDLLDIAEALPVRVIAPRQFYNP